MILLVSGATVTVAKHPDVGVLLVPRARQAPLRGRPYAIDNGAFSGFDASAFLRMIEKTRRERCLFVAAPDVVGNHGTTLTQFRQWEPMLHRLDYPVAFVGQDGVSVDQVPWESCEAIFIGGTTDWKLGSVARDLAAYGRARGKWVHMGRVNSQRRLRYATRIGVQSVDGSSWSRWADRYIPTFDTTMVRYAGGPLLHRLEA